MSGPKPPKAASPEKTAAAQTATNIATANANTLAQNGSITTPDGVRSTAFTTQQVYDPVSKKYQDVFIPNVTETLSAMQQRIKDQSDSAELNMATTGNRLSKTLGDQLTTNFKIGNEPTEARLWELGRKRLDPKFQSGREDLQTQLSNQGIKLGSAAWDRAMNDFGQQENDAYNQLLLTGRSQATQEQFAEDNQRFNQLSALQSGSQVNMPNFTPASTGTIPTTDYAGIRANYDAAMAQRAQSRSSPFGSILGGIGSIIGGLRLSDRRVKKNIAKVGKTSEGFNLYKFNYKNENGKTPRHVGVMAQEVEKKKPSAIRIGRDGLRRVDYSQLRP